MTVGDGTDEALASRTAAIAAYHVGGDPGLVDEDETSWVQSPLAVAPSRAGRRHVRPVLLGGTKRLFLSRRPRRSSVRHRQPRLTVTPRSAASQSRQFRERRVGLCTQARQQRLLMARELAGRAAARQRAL
jgi:hypothetical protein